MNVVDLRLRKLQSTAGCQVRRWGGASNPHIDRVAIWLVQFFFRHWVVR